MANTSATAILALADGTLYPGRSIGVAGAAAGEVVFNTAMTGYQEIVSDPSYSGQLVTMTSVHIGNTGVTDEDMESARAMAAGLIVRDCPAQWNNWRGRYSLPEFLRDENVVGIADIDTRALTRKLRDEGAMGGCIVATGNTGKPADAELALRGARECPDMRGQDLARVVTCHQPYHWREASLDWVHRHAGRHPDLSYHVIAYDYGIKYNILRMLVDHGCNVDVVPATTPVAEVLARSPDGVFLSNGPGDPEPCGYAIRNIRELLERRVPLFGICLGHQLLGLACGGKTVKMKFGHHGANHPVQDLDSGQVMITSQNHGFAVDEDSLPDTLRPTHRSLFDGSLQGVVHTDAPAFGFQGHPEASPGPHDIAPLFQRFIDLMQTHRTNTGNHREAS